MHPGLGMIGPLGLLPSYEGEWRPGWSQGGGEAGHAEAGPGWLRHASSEARCRRLRNKAAVWCRVVSTTCCRVVYDSLTQEYQY